MQKINALIIFLLLMFSFDIFAADKSQNLKFEEYKAKAVPDDIAIYDEVGNKHYLEEYEGKAVLLVFWATWCSPCAQEMLDLDNLQKDFRKLPFIILPVAEDHSGIKIVGSFYKSNYIRHLPLLHDYKNALFNAFGVIGMPTAFLITEDGMNVATFKGAVNWYDEEVRSILLAHIPGNPSEPKNSHKARSLNQIIQKPKPIPDQQPQKDAAPNATVENKPLEDNQTKDKEKQPAKEGAAK